MAIKQSRRDLRCRGTIITLLANVKQRLCKGQPSQTPSQYTSCGERHPPVCSAYLSRCPSGRNDIKALGVRPTRQLSLTSPTCRPTTSPTPTSRWASTRASSTASTQPLAPTIARSILATSPTRRLRAGNLPICFRLLALLSGEYDLRIELLLPYSSAALLAMRCEFAGRQAGCVSLPSCAGSPH